MALCPAHRGRVSVMNFTLAGKVLKEVVDGLAVKVLSDETVVPLQAHRLLLLRWLLLRLKRADELCCGHQDDKV